MSRYYRPLTTCSYGYCPLDYMFWIGSKSITHRFNDYNVTHCRKRLTYYTPTIKVLIERWGFFLRLSFAALKMTHDFGLHVIPNAYQYLPGPAPCAGVRINVDNFHLFMSYKTFTFVSLLTNKTSQNEKCKQFSMGVYIFSCFS